MRIRLALILALAATGLHAQSFSSLEERMSSAEFKAAGLDKLSADELAALNSWLQTRPANSGMPAGGYAPAGSGEDRIGFHDSQVERSVVSRIAGEFTGWNGNTKFTLENGQVWQQIESDTWRGGKAIDRPAVTIEPAFMGSWLFSVEGYNRKVRVRRIK